MHIRPGALQLPVSPAPGRQSEGIPKASSRPAKLVRTSVNKWNGEWLREISNVNFRSPHASPRTCMHSHPHHTQSFEINSFKLGLFKAVFSFFAFELLPLKLELKEFLNIQGVIEELSCGSSGYKICLLFMNNQSAKLVNLLITLLITVLRQTWN